MKLSQELNIFIHNNKTWKFLNFEGVCQTEKTKDVVMKSLFKI